MQLLTIDEAAAEWRITPATVRAWRLMGKITIVKIGRSVRVPKSEIDRVIREGLRPARGNRQGSGELA